MGPTLDEDSRGSRRNLCMAASPGPEPNRSVSACRHPSRRTGLSRLCQSRVLLSGGCQLHLLPVMCDRMCCSTLCYWPALGTPRTAGWLDQGRGLMMLWGLVLISGRER